MTVTNRWTSGVNEVKLLEFGCRSVQLILIVEKQNHIVLLIATNFNLKEKIEIHIFVHLFNGRKNLP